MNRDDKIKWKVAIDDELNSLAKNQTWELVKLPPNFRPITSKWIFKVKRDENNNISRYKARLVARGFDQRPGIDYHETFAPVCRGEAFRCLMAIASKRKYYINHLDIKTAYLNGDVEEELYMTLPPGLSVTDERLVCRLKKSLYGLKQAARQWYLKLSTSLLELGFVQSK